MSAATTATDDDLSSSFCRVCLELPEPRFVLDLKTIYDEDEGLTYEECFTICTNIVLDDATAGEDVPRNLCKSCGLELQMAYDFYKKVEYSNNRIKQLQEQQQEQLSVATEEIDKNAAEEVAKLPTTLTETEKVVEGEEQLDVTVVNCGDEIEEHLDMDEFQVVEEYQEELDDEDAETIQIEIKSDAEEFIITLSDNEYDPLEIKAHTDQMSWQQAVVAVANESHLPLKRDQQQPTKDARVIVESEGLENDKGASTSGQPAVVAQMTRKRYSGQYSCDYCLKVFPNHSRMSLHRRSHEPDRPKYPCCECGRIYATKQAMEVHVRTVHTKIGYSCPVCDKIYAIKKGLDVHMRYHTGDFPYECALCDKKFAQMCHLNTHNSVKHNSIRFCCEHPDCGKFFTSSASLRNHEFSHGTMPFECEHCQQGYPAKSKLKVHIRRKHGLELTLDELECMRKFHVMRSKLNLVKILKCED